MTTLSDQEEYWRMLTTSAARNGSFGAEHKPGPLTL